MPAQKLEIDMFWDMGIYYVNIIDEQGEEYLVAHGDNQRDVERDAASMLRRLAEKIEHDD